MQQVSIKSDVGAYLKLLASAVFKDPLCFIDEIIQNAERAGCKNIMVSKGPSFISFTNDGAPLEDASVLFHIAKSGWQDENVLAENPFGMGFFSIVPVASKCTIRSGHISICWDILKALAGDLAVNVEHVDEFFEGFELYLTLKESAPPSYEMYARVQEIGKYCDTDIYINGDKVEKAALPSEGNDFKEIFIDLEGVRGVIKIHQYSFYKDVKVYYRGRSVCTLEGLPYASGDIWLSKNILTLGAPDRKSIVLDDKYYAFLEILRGKISENIPKIFLELSKQPGDTLFDFDAFLTEYMPKTFTGDIPLRLLDPKTAVEIKEFLGTENYKSLHSYINHKLESKKAQKSTTNIFSDSTKINSSIKCQASEVVESIVGTSAYREEHHSADVGTFSEKTHIDAQINNVPKAVYYVRTSDLKKAHINTQVVTLLQLQIPIVIVTTQLECRYAQTLGMIDISQLSCTSVLQVTATIPHSERACARAADLIKRVLENVPTVSDVVVGVLTTVQNVSFAGSQFTQVYTQEAPWLHIDGVLYISMDVLGCLAQLSESKSLLTKGAYMFLYHNRPLIDAIAKELGVN